MDLNRRSLLRLFGSGAVVAPIIEASPLLAASVRLVEPAKFELVREMNEDDMPRTWLNRLDSNPFERLWLARWRHEQANYKILEHLLLRDPTADERAVVAQLMQWFGTNCGLSFIHETFRLEGYYLRTIATDENNDQLQKLHRAHPREWPEFIQLRLTGGNPELDYFPAVTRNRIL